MLADKAPQATLAVKDLARARPFYEQTLGLTPLPGDQPSVQAYRAGAATLLVYESQFAGTNQATAITWALGEAFDATVKALKAKGVAFEHYDFPGGRLDGDVHVMGDIRVVWFKDPDGNIISVGNY